MIEDWSSGVDHMWIEVQDEVIQAISIKSLDIEEIATGMIQDSDWVVLEAEVTGQAIQMVICPHITSVDSKDITGQNAKTRLCSCKGIVYTFWNILN